MSWKDNLLDASYRESAIYILDESMGAERAIAKHGTPFVEGDSAVDLGRGAREFDFRLVCFGDNYEIELQAIISALEIQGPGELVHPIYGAFNVVAKAWKVSHNAEHPDYAEVSVSFIEDTPETLLIFRPFGDETTDGVVMIDDGPSWQDRVFDLFGRVDSLVSEVQGWIGGGWVGLIEKALGLPGIELRLRQFRSQIMGVVAGVSSMFKHPSASFDPLVDTFRTPNEIRAAVQDYTPSTSGELLSKTGVPLTFPGLDALTQAAGKSSAEFLTAIRQGDAPSSIPSGSPTDPLEAAAFALLLLVFTELALSHAQAVAIIIEDEAKTPTLSPFDLESLVGLVRSLTQTAIVIHRYLYDVETARPPVEAMRNIASMIQVRARQVILLRPPLVDRVVETPASLRLLAHRWYGDHSRAVELVRLNPTLKTPHNIPAGEVLRAYAQ